MDIGKSSCFRGYVFVILFTFSYFFPAAGAGASVVIQSRIDEGSWESANQIFPLKGQTVRLKVARVEGAHITWFQIMPDLSMLYKNANFPWDPDPYQWKGFDRIQYCRKALPQTEGHWEIVVFSKDSPMPLTVGEECGKASSFYHPDVGTFWFQAVVATPLGEQKSPGIEEMDNKGLPQGSFRINVRDGDGYLGHLTSFFNVPGLFGSVPYQSSHHIGADCADILMAAYYQWKNVPLNKDYSVAMLVTSAPKVLDMKISEGNPERDIRWGKDILPGDFVAVRYPGQRQYQHIGALCHDNGQTGFLDSMDTVLHAGPYPLHESELGQGGFDGEVRVLRRPRISSR